jgi:hypothetical protein
MLRIALRPLVERVPVVGAVQVSFLEAPAMEYDLAFAADTAVGSALNFMLSSIKTWLDATLREAIFMPYVMPKHYFLPIAEGVADISLPVGMLILTVVEARGVPRCVNVCLRAPPRRADDSAPPHLASPSPPFQDGLCLHVALQPE